MRRVTAQSLQNAALFHLRKYSASVLQLRRVLTRKVQRFNRLKKGEPPVDASLLIAELLLKLVQQGYLDDSRLAEVRSASLRRSGRSARMIRAKLQEKGLGAEVARVSLPSADEEVVWVHARKKRLGPYGKPEKRKERRLKDLASLARAGFSFALAKKVIDAEEVPDHGSG
jgi:regulatory protein